MRTPSPFQRLREAGVAALAYLLLSSSHAVPAEPAQDGDSAKVVLAVGYADQEIDPPLGVGMPGYFHERKATGVLDPLRAKALVLTRGERTLAIVAVDLIEVSSRTVQKIRTAVEEQTAIPPHRVFIHATHTHTGARLSEIEDRIVAAVAAAVKKAVDLRRPEADVRLGSSKETSVSFIRRYLMKDGTVRTNPGQANPEIVRPVGEIDPLVHVLCFESSKTLLVSHGLHCDCVTGTMFSADYPFHITEAVRAALGAEWSVLYLNACCGNVNHINVGDPEQRSSYEESRRIGRVIAKAALAAREGARKIDVDRLEACTETVACRTRKVPQAVLDWAKREMEKDPAEASKRKFNELTPSGIVDLAAKADRSEPAEIIALAVGPVGIVGLPAEAFVEIARDIKMHSLLDPTLVIGLTGGSMGYLPHPRGYEEGGYEATYSSARWEPETGLLWSDAATRLLKTLRGGGEK